MIKRISLLLIISSSLGFSLYGRTTTQALTIVPSYMIFDASKDNLEYSLIGLGYRSTSSSTDSGFYYGIDFVVGVALEMIFPPPIEHNTSDNPGHSDSSSESSSNRLFSYYLNLKIPLGYKWSRAGRSLSFYLGGGLMLQAFVYDSTSERDQSKYNYDHMKFLYSEVLSAGGVFAEFGLESKRENRMGFNFGFRISVNALVNLHESGSYNQLGHEFSILTGMQWRRKS